MTPPVPTTTRSIPWSPGARLAGAALLTLALIAALGLPAAPAQASSNSGVNGCLRGYNYADASSDYLFASSSALADDCAWVHVELRNHGSLNGSGFQYSWCEGTALGSREGSGYVSTSTTLDSNLWQSPCSNHIGAPQQYMIHKWGGLFFL